MKDYFTNGDGLLNGYALGVILLLVLIWWVASWYWRLHDPEKDPWLVGLSKWDDWSSAIEESSPLGLPLSGEEARVPVPPSIPFEARWLSEGPYDWQEEGDA